MRGLWRKLTYPARRWPRLFKASLAGGEQGRRSEVREVLSRVKAIADTTLNTPAMGGREIPISGDDGRVSWGPAPPAGTPPAGSPDRS